MSTVSCERSCAGKRKYANAAEANGVITVMVADGAAGRGELRAYLCDFCARWHVGHRVGLRSSQSIGSQSYVRIRY
jgi:hypothetical protein